MDAYNALLQQHTGTVLNDLQKIVDKRLDNESK